MPDSYGICLTAVFLRGPSTALAISMPAAIAKIATRMMMKIGVNCVTMSGPFPWAPAIREHFHEVRREKRPPLDRGGPLPGLVSYTNRSPFDKRVGSAAPPDFQGPAA